MFRIPNRLLLDMPFAINFWLALHSCAFLSFLLVDGLTSVPKLLLVSYDGFGWQLLDRLGPQRLPTFHKLASDGVIATHGIKNVYPTITLPNHQSLITGLYPESHGIVGNRLRDPLTNEIYLPWKKGPNGVSVNYMDGNLSLNTHWFANAGLPIWYVNQLAGENHRSGMLNWLTNPVQVNGSTAFRYTVYDPFVRNESLINKVIDWFTDKKAVNLLLLYFPEIDEISHSFGPLSIQVEHTAQAYDKLLSVLVTKLKKAGLYKDLNIILTADHGQTVIPPENDIHLDGIFESNLCHFFSDASAGVEPNQKGDLETVYRLLKQAHPHLHVYYKHEFPAEFHFRNSPRIGPLLLLLDDNWKFSTNSSYRKNKTTGSHGIYSNALPSQQPFFIAHGPAFKRGFLTEQFSILDIFPLMCHILHLTPPPNNGSLDRVKHILHVESLRHSRGFSTTWHTSISQVTTRSTSSFLHLSHTLVVFVVVILLAALITGVFCIGTCRQQRRMRQHRIAVTQHIALPQLNSNDSTKLLGHVYSSDDEELP